jgi:hypothetical protein
MIITQLICMGMHIGFCNGVPFRAFVRWAPRPRERRALHAHPTAGVLVARLQVAVASAERSIDHASTVASRSGYSRAENPRVHDVGGSREQTRPVPLGDERQSRRTRSW